MLTGFIGMGADGCVKWETAARMPRMQTRSVRDVVGEDKDPEGYWEEWLEAQGSIVRFARVEQVWGWGIFEVADITRMFVGRMRLRHRDIDQVTDRWKEREVQEAAALLDVLPKWAGETAPEIAITGGNVVVGTDTVGVVWELLVDELEGEQ